MSDSNDSINMYLAEKLEIEDCKKFTENAPLMNAPLFSNPKCLASFSEFGTLQKSLQICRSRNMLQSEQLSWLQKSASIPPRTSCSKFGAELFILFHQLLDAHPQPTCSSMTEH